MKKLILKMIFLSLIFLNLLTSVRGQYQYYDRECGMPDNPSPSNSSSSFIPFCISQGGAASPGNDLFLPTVDTKTLKIKVNYIFWTNPNIAGGGNFDPIIHADIVDGLINEVNRRMANLVIPSNPNCTDSPFITDSKIEYVVSKFWIEDEYAWNVENGKQMSGIWMCPSTLSSTYNDYIHQVLDDENIPDGIDVYFGQEGIAYDSIVTLGLPANAEAIDCSQGPNFTDFNRISDVQMLNEYLTFAAGLTDPTFDQTVWLLRSAKAIAHELGHSFDLGHDTSCLENIMNDTKEAAAAGRNYLRATQITKMHRSLGLSSVRRLVCCEIPGEKDLVFSSDETIDFNLKVHSDIIIESGATVMLTCKLLMPKEGRIIVRSGGKLIVDGGEITIENECNFWDGIRLEGNTKLTQTPQNQGVVELLNDAIIKHAEVGIQVGYAKKNTNTVNSTGGIILATDANFLNNRTAISFYHYKNIVSGVEVRNESQFNNCKFEVNNDFRAGGFRRQFRMDKVRGIELRGCDFENTKNYNGIPPGKVGYAIESMDASYKVSILCESTDDPCLDPFINSSTFSGFEIAINASNISTVNTFSVYEAEFTKNRIGIQTNGVNNPRIARSDFYVGNFENPWNLVDVVQYGILVNTGTGFTIEENHFFGNTDDSQIAGIRVFDSGENANQIYKNDFMGSFTAGNIANGINRSFINQTGLQYRCNNNELGSGNIFDFYVIGAGINIFQGSPDLASGNKFSLNANNTSSDFSNYQIPSANIQYHYNFESNNSNSEEPVSIINLNEIQSADNECPSNPEITDDIWDGTIFNYYSQIHDDANLELQNELAQTQDQDIGKVSDLYLKLNDASKKIVHHHLLNENGTDFSLIQGLWTNVLSPEVQYLIADKYQQEEDLVKSNQILSNIIKYSYPI